MIEMTSAIKEHRSLNMARLKYKAKIDRTIFQFPPHQQLSFHQQDHPQSPKRLQCNSNGENTQATTRSPKQNCCRYALRHGPQCAITETIQKIRLTKQLNKKRRNTLGSHQSTISNPKTFEEATHPTRSQENETGKYPSGSSEYRNANCETFLHIFPSTGEGHSTIGRRLLRRQHFLSVCDIRRT
jgi:hypothetical protein